MENLTIVGMKDLNQKLIHIDRSLERIAKALETQTRILNRQFPEKPVLTVNLRGDNYEEDSDDE